MRLVLISILILISTPGFSTDIKINTEGIFIDNKLLPELGSAEEYNKIIGSNANLLMNNNNESYLCYPDDGIMLWVGFRGKQQALQVFIAVEEKMTEGVKLSKFQGSVIIENNNNVIPLNRNNLIAQPGFSIDKMIDGVTDTVSFLVGKNQIEVDLQGEKPVFSIMSYIHKK